jgi:hypothetical protein
MHSRVSAGFSLSHRFTFRECLSNDASFRIQNWPKQKRRSCDRPFHLGESLTFSSFLFHPRLQLLDKEVMPDALSGDKGRATANNIVQPLTGNSAGSAYA